MGEGHLKGDRLSVDFWPGADLAGTSHTIAKDLAVGMPSYRVPDYFMAKPDIIGPESGVVVATNRETGRAIALLVATRHALDTTAYVSLDTILVAESHQKTILSARMLTCLIKGMARSSLELPNFLMLTTANPTSYCMINALVRMADARVYPKITSEQDPEDANLAAKLAKIHRVQFPFCTSTGVLTGGAGTVPPDFYPRIPTSRDQKANAYFAKHLGPNDRLLCLLIFPSIDAKMRLWNFLVGKERAHA